MLTNVSDETPDFSPDDLLPRGFKVHKMTRRRSGPVPRGRTDYYKMGIVTGKMTNAALGRVHQLDGTALFFVNPLIPHTVEIQSKTITGYTCVFTESFITGRERAEILKMSPLFQTNDNPLVLLNPEEANFITSIFEKMLALHNDSYHLKGELIRSCIELIIQEALRIQPSRNDGQLKNGAARLTHLFMDLLEKQFPIEDVSETITLRTAKDFAIGLSVHSNYLNRAVKQITGKPVSVIIAERIIAEAVSLLQYTEWNIAEIAYALGFEYPTYFNNYFKRITGESPNAFRKKQA